jgi:hypothetical protein
MFRVEAKPTRLESDEMRHQEDDRPIRHGAPIRFILESNDAVNALGRPPPEYPAFEQAARDTAEMSARKQSSLGFRNRRHAKSEVRKRHAPASTSDDEEHLTEPIADPRQHRER